MTKRDQRGGEESQRNAVRRYVKATTPDEPLSPAMVDTAAQLRRDGSGMAKAVLLARALDS